ncbi:AMP-binding protein, partial [Micromonospora sp. DH15]|nr:AMP-binding protein [Micromonospora sp. DH15]
MDLPFTVATLTRRGLLTPGPPIRVAAQLNALRRWGWSLAGELRQAAARDPGRTAVVDEQGAELTYGALLDRAERLAKSLRGGLGVHSGDRIGLLCRNHHGLIEAMVATTLLGADAVLVNTGLSPAQLATVAAEQGLKVLVHDAEFAERALGLPADLHRVDEARLEELIAAALPGDLQPRPRAGRGSVRASG